MPRRSFLRSASGGNVWETPLAEGTRTECNICWSMLHGFSIGAGRLSVSHRQTPMHAMSQAEAKDFPVLPIQRMRVQCGQVGSQAKQTEEEHLSLHLVYTKLRAFWTTLAYVNIDQ